MQKDFTPTTKELRDWADHPAESRMVPVSPTSLRAVADRLDAQADEIAALKASNAHLLIVVGAYVAYDEDATSTSARKFMNYSDMLKASRAAIAQAVQPTKGSK